MATAFAATGLLPRYHAYLNPVNAGKFGVRNVLAEARRNLVYDRDHIDQIVIYYTTILGLFIMMAQIVVLALAAAIGGALAANGNGNVGAWFARFLVTNQPADDIAFNLLDRVFGVPGLFGSCADPAVACTAPLKNTTEPWPTPFHQAMHLFFNFYNVGIIAVAIIVFLYLVATVVAETAQTGTPFGHRFNRAWAVPRMILAVGLLVPFAPTGFNGAQLITLHIAKWGSNLATNAWTLFFNDLTNGYTQAPGTADQLVVRPTPPGFNQFLEYMMVAKVCATTEHDMYGVFVNPYQIYNNQEWELFTGQDPMTAFQTALQHSENHDIVVRYGVQDDNYTEDAGTVKPTCGEVVLHVKDLQDQGALWMEAFYFSQLVAMYSLFDNEAQNISHRFIPGDGQLVSAANLPSSADLRPQITWWNKINAEAVRIARDKQVADPSWQQNLLALGWAGASIWYNKIAQLNGTFVAAVYDPPAPTLYPAVMEQVWDQKKNTDKYVDSRERFNPHLSTEKMVELDQPGDMYIALALYYSQGLWKDLYPAPTGNIFVDTISSIFGLHGLFAIVDNINVHPLALLVGIGRSLMQTGIDAVGINFGTNIFGGIANVLKIQTISTFTQAASSFMTTVAILALSMGFILGYILPFLPFLYFFFATGNWVKGVFEAMVAMPLWAISHIRIDGDGVPGTAAMNGYYMLLEIFLRPVLIVSGLLSSVIIFASEEWVLHSIWPLVVLNLTGYNSTTNQGTNGALAEFAHDQVDGFFYLVMYTIVVYMMAMASFKLVDLIPNTILRWMNKSISAFSDYTEDPTAMFVENTFEYFENTIGTLHGGVATLFQRNS
jgi:conjugal transfer/type IV secretion protein DotA/TraY